jgi:hypothetical protein
MVCTSAVDVALAVDCDVVDGGELPRLPPDAAKALGLHVRAFTMDPPFEPSTM